MRRMLTFCTSNGYHKRRILPCISIAGTPCQCYSQLTYYARYVGCETSSHLATTHMLNCLTRYSLLSLDFSTQIESFLVTTNGRRPTVRMYHRFRLTLAVEQLQMGASGYPCP